jgi:hypothetical protein
MPRPLMDPSFRWGDEWRGHLFAPQSPLALSALAQSNFMI